MFARACLRQWGSTLNPFRDSSHTTYRKSCEKSMVTKQDEKVQKNIKGMDRVPLNPLIEHAPYTLNEEQVRFVSECSQEKQIKLQELLLKLYVKRQEGFDFPEEMRLDDLQILLNLGNIQLSKMLHNLRKRQFAAQKREREKEEYEASLAALRLERSDNSSHMENPWLEYSLNRNSLSPRIFKANVHRFYDTLTGASIQFGQNVVLDCSYESHMDDLRIKQTAKQIIHCYIMNRREKRPFSLHLCNFNSDSRLMYYVRRLNPQFEHDWPVSIHTSSYLDIFERKRLIYLTPHTDKCLEYNPNDIYILGGIVDRIIGFQLSNKKAAKENIRYACLPLKEHLRWKKGSKSLCIQQVFGTLLTVKNTGDWKRALLEQVPPRKIHNSYEADLY